MSSKTALLVVPHDVSTIRRFLDPLCGDGDDGDVTATAPLFSRVAYGNDLEAFREEKARGAGPVVVLVGGPGSHDVLKDVLSWTDTVAATTGASVVVTKRVVWVHSYLTGVDVFGARDLVELFGEIPVTNGRGVFASTLAEHVLFAALYFNRMPWRLQANRGARHYDRFPITPCAQRVMGIIGYGDIGRAVAERAIGGLGMSVKGLRRMPPPQHHHCQDVQREQARDNIGVALLYGAEGLDDILTTSDVVVLLLPITPATKHMLRREHFQKMKPAAIFVNIGRGATCVEDDLVDALLANEIRGAAVDVFEVEPLPLASRLWALDDSKILLSPHNAGVAEDSHIVGARQFAAAAATFAETNEVPNGCRVDIHRGY